MVQGHTEWCRVILNGEGISGHYGGVVALRI